MRVEFTDGKEAIGITLIPENMQESMQLLRYVNNAKMAKPFIQYSISDNPVCAIYLDKVKESVQENIITP